MNVMEDLKAYVDGELSPARRSEIESAMEQDERLRQELEEIRVLSRLIGDCIVEPEPVGLEQTLGLLEARKPKPIWTRVARQPWRYAWVGALGVFVIIAIVFPVYAQSKASAKRSMASRLDSGDMAASTESAKAAASAPSAKQDATLNGRVSTEYDAMGGAGGESKTKGGFSDTTTGQESERSSQFRKLPGKEEAPVTTYGANVQGAPSLPQTNSNQAITTRPLLIRTADMTIQVASVQKAQGDATSATKMLGGYIEQSNGLSDENNVPQASLTLRVPEQRFEEAMARLRKLGKVTAESTSGQDVTAQVADTEARLKVMRAEEESYVTMLRAARRVTDLLEIKDRLSQVREQIESLDAQRKALRSQATYSTITVSLTQTQQQPKAPSEPSWFDQAWDGAKDRASGLGRWFAEIGMNLLLLAPIWVPIVVFFWWLGRRKGMRG